MGIDHPHSFSFTEKEKERKKKIPSNLDKLSTKRRADEQWSGKKLPYNNLDPFVKS
jgi:hypothetical protein